jgi:hypothetical protein
MLGALLDGTVGVMRWPGRPVRAMLWRHGFAVLASIGVVVLVVGIVRFSALLTPYVEWTDAGFVSDRFLVQAVPCFKEADGGTVEVSDLPHRIDYPTDQSQFVDAFIFEPYSLESAVRVLAPGTRVTFDVRSTVDVQSRPTDVQVTCTPASGRWLLSSRITN